MRKSIHCTGNLADQESEEMGMETENENERGGTFPGKTAENE